MEERYSRNRLYVSEREQSVIKDYKIFLGGAGIGSIIAECALRFGFEHITIVDGDKVEESNLNRQNYTENDIGRYKAECLAERLQSINPDAQIDFHTEFLTPNNIEEMLNEHDVAINALDFKDKTPFVFDEICKERKIPVLHPYNFGWAGFVTVVDPLGHCLSELTEEPKGCELKVAEYVTGHGAFWNQPKEWLEKIVTQYKKESEMLPSPQLSIASWIATGLCTTAMYNLATGKPVNYFPKFYFSSLLP